MSGQLAEMGIIIVVTGSIVVLLVVGFLLMMLHVRKRSMMQQKEILQYQDNLEEIYDMMHIFRHDYKNTIIALKGSYEERDYEKIGEILSAISADFEKIDYKHQMGIVSQIEDAALKWLLISKMSAAQSKNIILSLIVSKDIRYGRIKTYEFNNIIGNLLDNAIEAAEESEKRQVKIALLNKNGDTIISVKNTYHHKPALSELYKKGYTNKDGHSGYGLYHIKKMIDRYNEVLMDVRITDVYFMVDINISTP